MRWEEEAETKETSRKQFPLRVLAHAAHVLHAALRLELAKVLIDMVRSGRPQRLGVVLVDLRDEVTCGPRTVGRRVALHDLEDLVLAVLAVLEVGVRPCAYNGVVRRVLRDGQCLNI